MISLKLIQENPSIIIERLKIKNFNAEAIISEIISIDDLRRKSQFQLDGLQNELNLLSKEIGDLFKLGKKNEAEEAKAKTNDVKERIKELSVSLKELENSLNEKLVLLPNIPHNKVPAGKSANDNEVVRSGGPQPVLSNNALAHWDYIKEKGIIDMEAGNKITGAGFPVYKGKGARIQSALIQFFLVEAVKAGYTEIQVPILVNADSAYGTGQLPDKDGQMYYINEDNLYLIPTAEVPLTNLYRDEIINESDMPIKLTGYTPCFRREAGSYGKDVRGLNRVHQFDKVEIVCIEHPNKSYETLNNMINHVEQLLVKLNLPYRILRLCGGDMSFASAMTYDFEVFSSAQNKWLEVSSVSNFETFQSSRMKLRFKDSETKKNIIPHTLNGSALALPRILAALIENNQTSEGVKIPDVLIPYTGFNYL